MRRIALALLVALGAVVVVVGNLYIYPQTRLLLTHSAAREESRPVDELPANVCNDAVACEEAARAMEQNHLTCTAHFSVFGCNVNCIGGRRGSRDYSSRCRD